MKTKGIRLICGECNGIKDVVGDTDVPIKEKCKCPELIHGDCLDLMPDIPDKSIDMILCDLPYGTTACKWDTVIPLEPLWGQYNRITKDNGAIVLTASQPFTSALVMSNPKMFRYEMIWRKSKSSNFLLSKKQILKTHENVLIFYKKQPTFYPPTLKRSAKDMRPATSNNGIVEVTGQKRIVVAADTERKLEGSVFEIHDREYGLHPTQKPVALFEYLIKTYTNEGDLVLDNCAGSGTTAIAAINTNRRFIVIEKDKGYFDIMRERIKKHQAQTKLELK